MQMNEVQTLLLRRMKSLCRTEKTSHVEISTESGSCVDPLDILSNASVVEDDNEVDNEVNEEEEDIGCEQWDFVEQTEDHIALQSGEEDDDDDRDDHSYMEDGAQSEFSSLPPLRGDEISNPVCNLDEQQRFQYYMKALSLSKYPVINKIEILGTGTKEEQNEGKKQYFI